MEKPYVLIVDDNEATCTLVMAVLRRDFSVEIASDGAEALERLKTGEYAAILLDLRMPPPDGYAVMDALLQTRPDLLQRIVILSAALNERERQRIRNYPVCKVISKPFEVETLLAAVKACAGDTGNALGNVISSGVLLLLAEMFQRRWL